MRKWTRTLVTLTAGSVPFSILALGSSIIGRDFSGALLQMAVAVAPNVWIVWYMFQPHVKQSFLTAGRARSEGAGGGRSEARSET